LQKWNEEANADSLGKGRKDPEKNNPGKCPPGVVKKRPQTFYDLKLLSHLKFEESSACAEDAVEASVRASASSSKSSKVSRCGDQLGVVVERPAFSA
jgi:hypothetical protein